MVARPVMDSWAAMSPHIEGPMGSVCDWTLKFCMEFHNDYSTNFQFKQIYACIFTWTT